jgi:hypothetical protein
MLMPNARAAPTPPSTLPDAWRDLTDLSGPAMRYDPSTMRSRDGRKVDTRLVRKHGGWRRILALLALPGCSLIGMRSPEPPPRAEPVACSDSMALPIVDTAVAAPLLAVAVTGLVWSFQTKSCGTNEFEGVCNTTVGPWVALLFGVTGIAYGGSAWHGYATRNSCARAKADALAGWQTQATEHTLGSEGHLCQADSYTAVGHGECGPGLSCLAGTCRAGDAGR